MTSLFIDTSTNRLIIGLYKDKKEIALINEIANNDMSSKVLPNIKNILEQNNMDIFSIDDIYVVNGPGSFTGLRIGVTIAKTIAWSLNIPIYTISELKVIASTSTKKYIVPLIDARRGYVYAALYSKNLKNLINDKYVKYDDFINELKTSYKFNEIEFVSYDEIDNAIKPSINIEKVLEHSHLKNINPHMVKPMYIKKISVEK